MYGISWGWTYFTLIKRDWSFLACKQSFISIVYTIQTRPLEPLKCFLSSQLRWLTATTKNMTVGLAGLGGCFKIHSFATFSIARAWRIKQKRIPKTKETWQFHAEVVYCEWNLPKINTIWQLCTSPYHTTPARL